MKQDQLHHDLATIGRNGINRIIAMEREIEDMRAALAELVECKDMKDRANAISPVEPGFEKEILNDEYRRRQPRAWDRARAILAAAEQPAAKAEHGEQRPVTAREDAVLRGAAMRSAKLVSAATPNLPRSPALPDEREAAGVKEDHRG